jgi:uncharacterized protein
MSKEMQNKEIEKIASAPRQSGPLIYIIITLLIVAALMVGGVLLYQNINKVNHVDAKIAGQTYKLEIADTEFAREKGLSERDRLAVDGGMLFVFPKDDDWSIWMLQMRFPIDIIWLDSAKKVVGIKENATPGSYPEAFRADAQGRYVIELNSGEVQENGLNVGDTVQW